MHSPAPLMVQVGKSFFPLWCVHEFLVELWQHLAMDDRLRIAALPYRPMMSKVGKSSTKIFCRLSKLSLTSLTSEQTEAAWL